MVNLLRARRLFAGETVARLAVSGPGGHPQLMPVPMAVIDDGSDGVVACATDRQPRSLTAAARLRDIEAHPRVSLMTDSPDPSIAPWWVHADAVAEVLRPGGHDPRWHMAADALHEQHPSWDGGRLCGPIIWATVVGWTGWVAAGQAAAA